MPRDEDRVFDVSRPHKTAPDATSKPIIVGHHPVMNDPMVTMDRPAEPPHVDQPPMPIKVAVSMEDNEPAKEASLPPPAPLPQPKLPELSVHHPLAVHPPPEPPASDATPPTPAFVPTPTPPLPGVITPNVPTGAASPLNDLPLPAHHGGHIAKSPGKKNNRLALVVLLVLLVLLGAYAYADAKTSINLPFYLFRKSTPVATTLIQTTAPAVTDPYADWITYTSTAEPTLSFKYPSDWKVTKNTTTLGVDSADIVSSSGTDIYWGAASAGVGGQCDTNDTVVVNSVEPIPSAPSLYAVQWTTNLYTGSQTPKVTTEMGVMTSSPDQTTPPKTGTYKGCVYPSRFPNHKGDNSLSLGVKEGTYQASDLATLKLIFTSLKY